MRTKIVLYFLAIVAGSWSADAAEVSLLPQSRAKGSLVLLGDVAEVTSADAARMEQLKRIELFPTPAQHRSKLMHVRELAELLILHGIDIDDIEFTGARSTRVYGPLAAGSEASAEWGLPRAAAGEVLVVARRALNRGEVIRDADVELRPVDAQQVRPQLATQREAVVGMEVLSPIREGDAIALQQLRRPLLVKRGEAIRVRARAAGVQVTTTARATENGAWGDIIMVQSLEHRETYPAHVTGLRQAEVYATGVAAVNPVDSTVQGPSQFTEK